MLYSMWFIEGTPQMLAHLHCQSALCVTARVGGTGFSLRKCLLCCPCPSWERKMNRTSVQDVFCSRVLTSSLHCQESKHISPAEVTHGGVKETLVQFRPCLPHFPIC